MKEASGELSMTAVAVVAIAAVGVLFTTVVWPLLQKQIVQRTCDAYGSGYKAIKKTAVDGAKAEDNTANKYMCCPAGVTSVDAGCVDPD